MSDPIYLVLASNDYYAPLVAALLKSIEQNYQSEESVEVYIIDDGILPKNKSRLAASLTASQFRIHWHSSKSIVPVSVQLPADKSALPFTAYMRLFAPYIIPAEARKLLYLDVDTLVLGNIADLWHTDLQGHLCAAVQDIAQTVSCSWGGISNYHELGLAPDTKYYNTGVLLINVEKWRQTDVTNQVISCMNRNIKHVTYADQYGLNVILANQWQELDPRWNWFATVPHPNPFLIHFAAADKPIFATYASDETFKSLFFNYLNQTPWQNFRPISRNSRLIHKYYNKLKKLSRYAMTQLPKAARV